MRETRVSLFCSYLYPMKNLILPLTVIVLLAACSSPSSTEDNAADSLAVSGEFIEYNNPPAEGFNLEGSDVLAMLLADKTMQAMGGREAWDNTQYLSWNFFGRRSHVWNKWTGDIRIEVPETNLKVLMNINTKEGKVERNGQVVSDSLEFFLQKGYEWWVNDAYWLVMPYKLKDSGVTLKYIGEDTTQLGATADVLSLSFDNVGVTPENVYEVWIDTDSKLVTQWAYYPTDSTMEPRFVTPWSNYNTYGNILLSGDRGNYQLTDIQVLPEVPADLFTSFDQGIPLVQ